MGFTRRGELTTAPRQVIALCATNCSRKSAISPDSIGFLLDRFRFAVAAELQRGALGYKGHPQTSRLCPAPAPLTFRRALPRPPVDPPVVRAGRTIRNSEFGADCRSPMMRPERTTRSTPPCTLHPAPCTLHPAPCTLHPAPDLSHDQLWSSGIGCGYSHPRLVVQRHLPRINCLESIAQAHLPGINCLEIFLSDKISRR
jgi:hypothetical protein